MRALPHKTVQACAILRLIIGIQGVILGDAVDYDGDRSKRWFVMLRSIGGDCGKGFWVGAACTAGARCAFESALPDEDRSGAAIFLSEA
jgi:hypothetical protein